ncbi:MAG: hypothetical protein ACXW4Z_12220 [Candidatus Binatia bacterium]
MRISVAPKKTDLNGLRFLQLPSPAFEPPSAGPKSDTARGSKLMLMAAPVQIRAIKCGGQDFEIAPFTPIGESKRLSSFFAIGEAGEPAAAHAQREVLPFNIAG